MKMIIAYVQPQVLPRLTQALQDLAEFPGLSVLSCEGFGAEGGGPGAAYSPFHERRRLEIFAAEEQVERIVTEIVRVAHSGHRGDGKVYVVEVAYGARIRTGERGPETV